MSDIKWWHDGDKLVLEDQETSGTLHLWFNPAHPKYASDDMWKIINDVVTSIEQSELVLSLKGHSMIEVRSDVRMSGGVFLKSAFLRDPVIQDSNLDFVSIKTKSIFKNSQVRKVGYTKYGYIEFINSVYDGDVAGNLPIARELRIQDGKVEIRVQ